LTLEIIGAGVGRTGTTSLKMALEQLGRAPCYHATDFDANADSWWSVLEGGEADWKRIFEGYRAALDWPTWMYFEQLADVFPDALVLLTVRDAHQWYESFHDTVYSALASAREQPEEEYRRWAQPRYEHLVERPFHGRFADVDYAIGVYRAHIDAVQRAIPAERLLVYDVAEGWAPLCRALGVPVVREPYPRVNTRSEFRRAMAGAPENNLRLARQRGRSDLRPVPESGR
jgi:Sulfotransferase domain